MPRFKLTGDALFTPLHRHAAEQPHSLFDYLVGPEREQYLSQERHLRHAWRLPLFWHEFPTDREAARHLLLEVGALRENSRGEMFLGPGTAHAAYLEGTRLLFERKIKIKLFELGRSGFHITVTNEYDKARREIEMASLKAVAAMTPRFSMRRGSLACFPGLLKRMWDAYLPF
jgi:hypothetical protein